MLGPITAEHQHIFVRNPRFTGLKFPDMSRPETLDRKYGGKMDPQALSFLKATLAMEPAARLSCPQVGGYHQHFQMLPFRAVLGSWGGAVQCGVCRSLLSHSCFVGELITKREDLISGRIAF